MSKLLDLYNKSEESKLPVKVDRTPISDADFDNKKLEFGVTELEEFRKGKIPTKRYSDITVR